MNNKIIIILLLIFIQACSGRHSDNNEKLIEGFNRNNKYIDKEIVCNGGVINIISYNNDKNKIDKNTEWNCVNEFIIKLISNDNTNYIAQSKYQSSLYAKIPIELFNEGKVRFTDTSVDKERLELFKHKVSNAKYATVELIDQIIAEYPKYDKFNTKNENNKIKESLSKKFGIIKTAVDVKPEDYDAEKQIWGWPSGCNTLKRDTKNLGESIGSNIFGVSAKYKTIEGHSWNIYWRDSFLQSREEARNTKSITVYGTINSAGIDYDHRKATLDSLADISIYINRVDINVVYGEAILKDGSSRMLLPVKR